MGWPVTVGGVVSWRWMRGIDGEPAGADAEVVVAAAKATAAQLQHLQPPALRAVLERDVLELDHAVREAVELQVAFGRGLVVEQQHRAVPRREELLEGEDLPPEAQRVAGEQPHLGERVEHDEPRPAALDRGEHAVDRLLELHLGGMEQRVALRASRRSPRPAARTRRSRRASSRARRRPRRAPRGSRRASRTGPRSPRATPARRNWRASVVFPVPGEPSSR